MPTPQSESNCCKADVNMAGVCMKCKNLCIEIFSSSPQKCYKKLAGNKDVICPLDCCKKSPQEGWEKTFCELDGSISSKTQKKYLDFIRTTIASELELYKKGLVERGEEEMKTMSPKRVQINNASQAMIFDSGFNSGCDDLIAIIKNN